MTQIMWDQWPPTNAYINNTSAYAKEKYFANNEVVSLMSWPPPTYY